LQLAFLQDKKDKKEKKEKKDAKVVNPSVASSGVDACIFSAPSFVIMASRQSCLWCRGVANTPCLSSSASLLPLPLPQGAIDEPISADDYFKKNPEFRVWLSDAKGKK
jgi:hypothetical protein